MKHIILLFACVYLAFSVNLSAQNVAGSVEVGVYSAYQFTQFSGGYIEPQSFKANTEPFSSKGVTVGGMVEYHISSLFSFVGLLRYEVLSGQRSLNGGLYPIKLPDGTEITRTIYYQYEITAPQITSSVLSKIIVSDTKLSILGGVNLGVLINDKHEERLELEGYSFNINQDTIGFPQPPLSTKGYNWKFTDDSHSSITTYSGPIYQRTALQLGLTAGLQYDLPIYTLDEVAQKFVTLTPSVLFNYNLTTYSDYEKLRAWNVSAGFVLKVGL